MRREMIWHPSRAASFLALLALLAGCNETSRERMVQHRREGMIKAYDEAGSTSEDMPDCRTDLSALQPQANLDRALDTQLARSRLGVVEAYQPGEERRRQDREAFTLDPKDENGPVIFLKPVKP